MNKNKKNKQNRRQALIEKIIREEIACSNEKFLVEASGRGTGMHRNGAEVGFTQGMGLRGGAATLPEPVQGREQDCVESDMGGCIDPPDLKKHFVESDISHEEEGLDDLGEPIQRFRGQRRPKSAVEPLKAESRKISGRLAEIAQQSDQKDYGVDTTSSLRPEVGAADLDMNVSFPDGGDSGAQAPEPVGTTSPGMGSKTNIDIKYSDDPLAFPLDTKDAFTDSTGVPSGVESKYLSESQIKRLKLLTFGK